MTDDHSNTIAEATALTLNTSIPGRIDPANDVDYFSIEIRDTPAIVSIFSTGITSLDPVASLQDNTGDELASNDDIESGRLNFLIQARLNPGTYYIQVGSYRSRSTGDYVLHVDVTDDHSNTREGATEIELDIPVPGTITPANDVDYFRIDVDTPTIVLISTIGTLNTRGRLLDNTGAELTDDDDSGEGDNFLIRYLLDSETTYYIEVSTLSGDTGGYSLHVEALVQQISLIIPSTLVANEIVGSTMIDVKHDEPFPVYISVAISDAAVSSLRLTLDGTQDGTLPPTLRTSALGEGQTWSELFVGSVTPAAGTGERYYRYCYDQAGIQDCSSSILVSYSSPDIPVVDVDDEIGSEWDFTLSDQTATARCSPNEEGTFPTVLTQEGNAFTSTSPLPEIPTYTGIVDGDSIDGDSYSLAYRDPSFNVGTNEGTYIDIHATQYSDEPMLFGPGVWWWTDRAGFLCRGTYNIKYTPRPHIDSIAVASTSVSEDVGNVAVTVTLTYPPVQPVVATLEIESTATDADYQVEQDISFGIGEEQTTLNLFIVDDDLVELDETIILRAVSQDSNKLVGASSTALTIKDNDVPAISFQESEYPIPEGTTGTITLVTDQPPLVKTQIRLTTLSGTTVLNEDYRLSNQLSNRIITFEPDQDTASFEVSIEDDEDVQETRELHLSFELLDSNSKPGTVSETIITIEDNELEISLRPRRIVVTESTSTGFVTLQLEASRLTSIPLTVNLLYTADVGALTGELSSDNTSNMSTMITVETADITTRYTFQVEVKDDEIAAEGIRTAQVVLQSGAGYTVSDTDNTVEIAVVDDDVATVNISSVREQVTEGDDIEFIITKNLIADTVTSVNIEFEDMGNFFKIATATTQVNFPADGVVMSTAKIVIPTVDNDDVEADGSLRAAIDITGSVLRAGMSTERTVTILNNDVPAIRFEEPGYVIFKGTTGTITLIADQPPVVEAWISLTALSDTVLNSQYSLSTTIIVFEPEQSTASFEVSIFDDVVVRSTRELSLSFDSLNNAIPGAVSETVISVRDNDMSRASLEVVGDDTLPEEGGSATLRVTLDLAFDRVTTIQIVIAGDTATPDDYRINDNLVEFPPGSTSAETTLVVIDDGQVELDETIMLRLEADNAQIIVNRPEAQLTLTIEDNDVPVAISFQRPEYTISEGTTTTIILEADPPPVVKTQISLTIISETTVSDDDYDLSTTIITFEPDQSTASFEVLIMDDFVIQSTRKLSLSFDPLDANAIPGATSKTVISVRDNNVSNASLEVVGNNIRLEEEGEDSATLRVTLDRSFDRVTTIQIETTGTATLGGDYRINVNPVEFMPGSTSAETTLRVIDDGLVEPEETIILRLNASNEQIIDGGSSATLTIEDNDVPAIRFELAAYTILEGTTGIITLEADQLPVVKALIRLTTLMETTISNAEYELSTRTVVFESRQRTASFEVSTSAIEGFQANRVLYLSFDPLTNSTRGEVFETVISVRDNTALIASLEVVGDDTLLEGGDDATLRVTLDRAFDRDTTIRIVTTGTATLGTAALDGDYRITVNPVMLREGSISTETRLVTHDDSDQEPNETIILTLNADHDEQIIIGNESGVTLTIEDDDATVPSAPTGVSAVAGDREIIVSWTAVPEADAGGRAITTYTATATGDGNTCTASGDTTSCTIPDLTNRIEYSVTVVATNAIGDSTPSNVVMATPVAPLTFDRTITDQVYTVRQDVSLELPGVTGGLGTLSYTLTPIPTGLEFTTATDTRMLTGTPTTPAGTVTLTYRVADRNTPPATATLTFMVRVDANVPLAPTGVSAVAGNGEIAVSWIAVLDADNGGSDITTYTATATGDGSTETCTAAGDTATSCTIPNLTNRIEYSVTVVATNAIGDSTPSNVVMATPVAPLTFGTASIENQVYTVGKPISVAPLPPAAAGTGTGDLSYALTPILPPGLTFTTATRTLTGTPTMVFDPATLTYTVTDKNTPPATAVLTFMVRVDATVPLAPTGVSAVAGNTTITVSWTALSGIDTGGSAITTYTATAQERTNIFTCTATSATATSCTIPGLTNRIEYSVTVVATNAIGDSTPSNVVMATPVAPLTFGTASIENQVYTVGKPISVAPLPPAAAGTGTGDLSYALTPILPPGLTFTTATRTLTGTPTMVFDPATLTYTVTDKNTPPATAVLTFMVRVDATVPLAPTGVSAVAGNTTITVSWTAVPGYRHWRQRHHYIHCHCDSRKNQYLYLYRNQCYCDFLHHSRSDQSY